MSNIEYLPGEYINQFGGGIFMALVKWDPFRELAGLQQSINRIFEDNLRYPRESDGNLAQGWMFPVDIKDTPEAVLIKAELPGMNREDIKISFSDNLLTIRGERKKEEKEEKHNYLRVERSYGTFSRSFSVDVPVKENEIKARYQDGVLNITLPKKEDYRKEVSIEIGE
ncbi:MAG: Molecular chaperone [Pelotomaculum thermopropionicum]|uniref:Molecular chaperone n=1 Tax=Pelotomaculum thermopropionicum TaxID=110500 RepID=A0A124FZ75_9FIRM|nr:MAG: Molecular chaperone [Pelotomaculum thermopropionicum]